jgi:hypothetical protein
MLDFLRALRRDRTFLARIPTLLVAIVVAELFYKFHSFTLECTAFLATWALIDASVEYLTPVHRLRVAGARQDDSGRGGAGHASP